MSKRLCMNCMKGTVDESGQCAACGVKESDIRTSGRHLPLRTILAGKYLIGKVLGEGGFGITYLGFDLNLEIPVAIKEFCPRDFAGREMTNGLTLSPFDEECKEFFKTEKAKFINEAKRLAKFRDEQCIVSVQDYFQENGTAYIVMEFIDGKSLKTILKERQNPISADELLPMLQPLIKALDIVHQEGIIHRDISPDNIMLTNDRQKIYLIDFGTARISDYAGERSLSVYKKGSYTPLEQQRSHGNQGPWTDVYAFCATIYLCLTGKNIPEVMERLVDDTILPPSRLGIEIAPHVEAALMQGLAVKPEQRIQSMKELQERLYTNTASTENVQNQQAAEPLHQTEHTSSETEIDRQAQELCKEMERGGEEHYKKYAKLQKWIGVRKYIIFFITLAAFSSVWAWAFVVTGGTLRGISIAGGVALSIGFGFVAFCSMMAIDAFVRGAYIKSCNKYATKILPEVSLREVVAKAQISYFEKVMVQRMETEVLTNQQWKKYAEWSKEMGYGKVESRMTFLSENESPNLYNIGEFYYQTAVEPSSEVSERTKQAWKQAWNNMCSRKSENVYIESVKEASIVKTKEKKRRKKRAIGALAACLLVCLILMNIIKVTYWSKTVDRVLGRYTQVTEDTLAEDDLPEKALVAISNAESNESIVGVILDCVDGVTWIATYDAAIRSCYYSEKENKEVGELKEGTEVAFFNGDIVQVEEFKGCEYESANGANVVILGVDYDLTGKQWVSAVSLDKERYKKKAESWDMLTLVKSSCYSKPGDESSVSTIKDEQYTEELVWRIGRRGDVKTAGYDSDYKMSYLINTYGIDVTMQNLTSYLENLTYCKGGILYSYDNGTFWGIGQEESWYDYMHVYGLEGILECLSQAIAENS